MSSRRRDAGCRMEGWSIAMGVARPFSLSSLFLPLYSGVSDERSACTLHDCCKSTEQLQTKCVLSAFQTIFGVFSSRIWMASSGPSEDWQARDPWRENATLTSQWIGVDISYGGWIRKKINDPIYPAFVLRESNSNNPLERGGGIFPNSSKRNKGSQQMKLLRIDK